MTGISRAYGKLQDLQAVLQEQKDLPATIQRKNGLCLKILTKQPLTLTHGNGCRNYGRTNAARQGRIKQIYFPALCAVPIAAKSCNYCTNRNFEARQDRFVCSTSRLKGKEVCATHFIRPVVLEQGVLAHLRPVISCVANHEERLRKAMGAKQKAEVKKELAAKRRQGTQAERQIEELDRLFKRIYEDNANEKLSDSRFQMLSDHYEQEQEKLRKKLLRLNEKNYKTGGTGREH